MTRLRSLLQISCTALALCETVGAAAARDTGCPGKNLLETIKTADASAFARLRAAADGAKNGRTLLWKIESEDAPDRPPSYLFATLHISDERIKAFDANVEDALSHSRRIATGVEDMSPGRVLEALGVMQETLLPDKAPQLGTLLAKPEAERAAVVLAHTELPKDWQPRVKPWVVLALATQSDCEQQRLKQGKLTLDGELERQAENRGVGTFGIETAEMELGALAAMTDGDQLSLLKANLASRARIDDQTETQVQLYLAHDIGALWPLQRELAKADGADDTALEAYRQNVLEDRTSRMRDRALMHLSEGGVFLAVGAMHLPGDKGLVELLRGQGYKLTAVQ